MNDEVTTKDGWMSGLKYIIRQKLINNGALVQECIVMQQCPVSVRVNFSILRLIPHCVTRVLSQWREDMILVVTRLDTFQVIAFI